MVLFDGSGHVDTEHILRSFAFGHPFATRLLTAITGKTVDHPARRPGRPGRSPRCAAWGIPHARARDAGYGPGSSVHGLNALIATRHRRRTKPGLDSRHTATVRIPARGCKPKSTNMMSTSDPGGRRRIGAVRVTAAIAVIDALYDEPNGRRSVEPRLSALCSAGHGARRTRDIEHVHTA